MWLPLPLQCVVVAMFMHGVVEGVRMPTNCHANGTYWEPGTSVCKTCPAGKKFVKTITDPIVAANLTKCTWKSGEKRYSDAVDNRFTNGEWCCPPGTCGVANAVDGTLSIAAFRDGISDPNLAFQCELSPPARVLSVTWATAGFHVPASGACNCHYNEGEGNGWNAQNVPALSLS